MVASGGERITYTVVKGTRDVERLRAVAVASQIFFFSRTKFCPPDILF